MNYKTLLIICMSAICTSPLVASAVDLCKDNNDNPPCQINAAVSGAESFFKNPGSGNINCTFTVISNTAEYTVGPDESVTRPQGYGFSIDFPFWASISVQAGIMEVTQCTITGNKP